MSTSRDLDYAPIVSAAESWVARIREIKSTPPGKDWTWYGYDIMANIWHLNAMLPEQQRDLFTRLGDGVIADIGCADGDLGFFFDSLGFDVDLIDWPDTNWNHLRGAAELKRIMGSNAGIHPVDLDAQFQLPRSRYDLVFLLGILYHLKNPYFVLEQLARQSRHCFLSTRIARQACDGKLDMESAPLAYLLNPDECNNDATNYWIFSFAGLVRLAERCGWRVLASHRAGDTEASDPADPEHDERAFLLLESRYVTG